ncbi:MAG: 2-phospho-L-lactate guanylyltransferase [Kiritimatiellaeota bacterium]|nr:2-phospho-L-lactate guanylyltransferase [Kiritimatiellota bacterium]
MKEIVFEVVQEADGGFSAEALGYDIFTQAESWEELRGNIKEATAGYFYDAPVSAMIRLHFSRSEVFALA